MLLWPPPWASFLPTVTLHWMVNPMGLSLCLGVFSPPYCGLFSPVLATVTLAISNTNHGFSSYPMPSPYVLLTLGLFQLHLEVPSHPSILSYHVQHFYPILLLVVLPLLEWSPILCHASYTLLKCLLGVFGVFAHVRGSSVMFHDLDMVLSNLDSLQMLLDIPRPISLSQL